MKKIFWIGVLPLSLFISTQLARADVFYVALDGSSTPPFNSWFSAATDLQVAIELASVTSHGSHQVWVKKGVYKPQFNPHTETADPREYFFALRNNVEVFGGFAGTETLLDQRDPETNQTILSGDREIADTWANGTEIVDGTGRFNPPPTGDPSRDLPVLNNGTNCYNVVYNPAGTPGIDASAVLDGVIVTGGNANGYGYMHTLNGGGMHNSSSSPTLTDCTFSGNSAVGKGGGLHDDSSSPTMTDCTFSGNSASYGGGINNDSSSPTLTDCTFSGNSAVGKGGGLHDDFSSPTLIDCTFSGNSSSVGGGIYNNSSSPTLINSTFSGNSASAAGGGMSNSSSSPTLIDCTFSGNSASYGGGIYNIASSAALTNCTFSNNSAPSGGGIFMENGSSISATACVFFGESAGGEFAGFTDHSRIRYSIVSGDIDGFGPGCSNADPLLGSFGYYGGATYCYPISSGSPAIDAGASVYRVTTDGNIPIYLVPDSSPATYYRVDTGAEYDPTLQTLEELNSHDQRGWRRSGRVDMGSYEYGAVPSPTPPPSPSPTPTCGPTLPPYKAVVASGDYNGDGTDDVAVFRGSTGLWSVRDLTSAYYGISTDQPAPGDYDGDGVSDIAVFRSASGQWFVRNFTRLYYGTNGDIPIPGDYDGDTIADIAVFRPATARWYIRDLTSVVFGANGDWPVPGDYDAGGSLQMAVYRPTAGYWAVSEFTRFFFGGSSDWPMALDYDGDGVYEPTVFRPCEGMWGIRNITREYLGICTDWPRPADYDGNGADNLAVFRDYSALWAIRELTRVYFGGSGDVPVTR